MEASDKFMFVNIREYLAEGDNDKVGEPELLRIISDFSCPKNPDVEHFLKDSSVDFTRKNQSVTYLVLDMDDGALVIFHNSIEAADGAGRNSKQYREKKDKKNQRI